MNFQRMDAPDMNTKLRYAASSLASFATRLLEASGLASERARIVAEVLVEGDLLGHTTHGLHLLPRYLREIAQGEMNIVGDPDTVSDRGAAITWDGKRLPGPWLLDQALNLAMERAGTHGLCTVVIRRSHHIGCLAAYLKRATDRGLVIMLMCSDPSQATVAPFGGMRPLYTPNPIAFGYPTSGSPVLIDVSTSTTTNGLTARLQKEGAQLDHPWLVDSEGLPSYDPSVLSTEPPGAILPLGGMDSGHKGFALALMVEALTSGLGGFGRADEALGWGASVFLQVIDPACFGGTAAFCRETDWLTDAARNTPAPTGKAPVRLPGERGLARRAEQLAHGVELASGIMSALRPWAERLGVVPPSVLA